MPMVRPFLRDFLRVVALHCHSQHLPALKPGPFCALVSCFLS